MMTILRKRQSQHFYGDSGKRSLFQWLFFKRKYRRAQNSSNYSKDQGAFLLVLVFVAVSYFNPQRPYGETSMDYQMMVPAGWLSFCLISSFKVPRPKLLTALEKKEYKTDCVLIPKSLDGRIQGKLFN